MKDLQGRVAVVTGAGSGIGKAVATRLARAGMKVAMADIEQAALDKAVAELRGAGHTVIGVRCDVGDRDQIAALADATVAEWGAVHVVHNNAGVVRGGAVAEIPAATWDWVLGVDLWSVIWGCEIFLPLIRAAGEGHIVNTASVAGLQAAPDIAPYNVAKSGVIALTETLQMELTSRNEAIGATVLVPGAVNTQIVFSDRNQPTDLARTALSDAEQNFRKRAGTRLAAEGMDPAEVADMVHDAIVGNRFWIITHAGWFDVMQQRLDGMRAGLLVQGKGG
jgi:NAD(P)-dependent dehydrogenase (short-subunit alcohol dehydrogenase family)